MFERTPLVIVYIILCSGWVKSIKAQRWNLGCFYQHTLDEDLPSPLDGRNDEGFPSAREGAVATKPQTFSLVPCAKHCLLSGAELMAVAEGAGCECLNHTGHLLRVDDARCNVRCRNAGVWLPCGGEEGGVRNVYTAAGPYLLTAVTSVSGGWAVSGVPVTLQASAQLAALHTCNSTGAAGSDEGQGGADQPQAEEDADDSEWERQLTFVWEVGGRVEDTRVTACSARALAHAPVTFLSPGKATINLRVSNAVSSVTVSVPVTVHLPRPRGLQIRPRDQGWLHTPSCVFRDPSTATTTTTNTNTNNSDNSSNVTAINETTTTTTADNATKPSHSHRSRRELDALGKFVERRSEDDDDDVGGGGGSEGGGRVGNFEGRVSAGGGERGPGVREPREDKSEPRPGEAAEAGAWWKRRGRAREDLEGDGGGWSLADGPYASRGHHVGGPFRSDPPGGEGGGGGGTEGEKTGQGASHGVFQDLVPGQAGYDPDGRWSWLETGRLWRREKLHSGLADADDDPNEDDDDRDVTNYDHDLTDDDVTDDDVLPDAVAAVFAGEAMEVWAGVASGLEPQFAVWVTGGPGGDAEGTLPPLNVSHPHSCLTEDCLAVAQVLLLPSPGVYTVHVTAANRHGQEQASLTVVAMDRAMGRLELSVQGGSDADPSTSTTTTAITTTTTTTTTLTFHLAMLTADRHNLFLYVDFGDGVVGFAPLRERRDSRVGRGETPPAADGEEEKEEESLHAEFLRGRRLLLADLTLVANYGEGCQLHGEFRYRYEVEGDFVPLATLVNAVTGETLTARVSSPSPVITVLNRLQLATLHLPSAVALGNLTSLSLQLRPSSQRLVVAWQIWDDSNDTLINETSSAPRLALTFNRKGVHRVRVEASNALGKVKAAASLLVQRAVDGLSLDCQPEVPEISVGQDVECRAQLKQGSHVHFVWRFGQEDGAGGELEGEAEAETEAGTVDEEDLSSRASHRYLQPGRFRVSVTASNAVGSLTASLPGLVQVDTPVRCLRVEATQAAPGQELFMEVTALGGSRLQFQYNFGQGRWAHRGHVQREPPVSVALLSHVYGSPGLHPVAVYAHNPVSAAQLVRHVVVQPLVGELQLVLQAPPSPNSSAILLVQEQGALAERDDVIFHLVFSDGARIVSASPVIGKRFGEPGPHSVNFTAFNQVDSFNRVFLLGPGKPLDWPEEPRLHHEAIISQSQQTTFTVLECPDSAEVIEVLHSDGTRRVFPAKNKRWSHVFASAGVHWVEVTIYGGRAGGGWRDRPSLRSVLLVQQPITGLELRGPRRVGIHCYSEWTGKVVGGSHMVCQWSLGGEREIGYTTILQYGGSFRAEGVYTLGLHCHNDISHASATIDISVSYPLSDLHLHVPVAVHLQPIAITASVQAGRHFTLFCDFGDGTVEEFSSSELQLSRVAWQPHNWQERFPVYNTTVKHLYSDIGAYNVVVTVYNDISTLTRQKTAHVEEAIGEIEVTSDVPDVVNATDEAEWTFVAVVGSGRNLRFAWDFGEASIQSPPVSEGNRSMTRHQFSIAGQYTVKVRVWNELQRDGVLVSLPRPVRVQSPVASLSLLPLQTEELGKDSGKEVVLGAHFHPQHNRSHTLIFQAKCYGDPVTFLFDFGDGNSEQVEGQLVEMFYFNVGMAKHQYTSEGVFTVTVTASNALSNSTARLPHPVYIQVPVQGPFFEPGTEMCTPFGGTTVLTASPIQGSNITFRWRMDDETEFVNANATVSHRYLQKGKETVEVTAGNQVSSETDYVVVNVVEHIQSVSIAMDTVIPAGEAVSYEAQVLPGGAGVTSHFLWDMSRSVLLTKEPRVTYTYRHSGPQRVTVTAHNCHHNVTSTPMQVQVVSRLAGLKIETKGDNLVNQSIKFSAFLYQGDSLDFSWDFGDGTMLNGSRRVTHSYHRVGEYIVTLQAQNLLGNDTVRHRLFVLTRFCMPPVVSIVGVNGKSDDVIQVFKWQAVRVESRVTLNCSVSGSLVYRWTIHAAEDGDWVATVSPVEVEAHLLRHPDLLLPPHSLPQGRYLLSLNVSVNGTEIPVYQEVKVRLEVTRSPVHSVIQGGVMRRVSRYSLLTLDGTGTLDPDRTSSPLKYMWNCRRLHSSEDGCFNESLVNVSTIKFDTPTLQLNSSWLQLDSNFVFNLTVVTPGMEASSATQLVQLEGEKPVIPLSVECRQCWNGLVNANDKVSMVAHCLGDRQVCGGQRELVYRWKVSVVKGEDGEGEDVGVAAHSACVMADGSSYLNIRHPNTTTTPTAPTTNIPTTTTTPVAKLAEGLGQDKGNDNQEGGDKQAATSEGQHSVLLWQDLEENMGPRSRTDTYRRGESRRVPGDFYPDLAEGSMGSARGRLPGGSQGRNLANGFPELVEGEADSRQIPTGHVTPPACDKCGGGGDLDERILPSALPPPAPHVTERKSVPLSLATNRVVSDPEGPSLVLRPGTLTQGLTYLVQVTATHPDNPGAEGLAMTSFRVNKSPRKGACSVLPSSGVEMETVFKVFCREWQDEQLPVWYEVSYSLENAEASTADSLKSSSASPSSSSSTSWSAARGDRHVVYRGLSHQVTFRLPAGLPRHDRKVYLELGVRDSRGAATALCRIPVRVSPRPLLHHGADTNDTGHQLLADDVRSFSHRLQSAVYRGGVNGVKDSGESFTDLAARLDRLATPAPDVNGSDDVTRRLADLRLSLLHTLKHMPLRDQTEVHVVLRCLLLATNAWSQVNGQSFALGVQLLERVAQSWAGMGDVGDGAGLGVEVASNLLRAGTLGQLMLDVRDVDKQHFKWAQRAVAAMQAIITLALEDHSLGEFPLTEKTDFVSVTASHYPTLPSTSSLHISGTTFTLPPSMEAIVRQSTGTQDITAEGWMDSDDRHCFQARAMAFQHNPFVYRRQAPKENLEIQSEVVSLDLFTCNGQQQLAVEQLAPNNSMQFIVPLRAPVEPVVEYRLMRSHMSVHQFNISHAQRNLYLSLLVRLAPVPTATLPFPITAIISQEWPPHPQENLYRQNFPKGAEQLRIFFQPDSLRGTGTYYLGLVETSLNSGRRRKTEVTTRDYGLNIWVGSCVYWNTSRALWSDEGCHVMSDTDTSATHCRCNHLTVFGSHFELIPNDLSFTDTDHFFGLHENPVVVLLVGMVVLLYLVLLIIARRADLHDLRKGGVVCLSDNNISDTQLYEIVLDTGLHQTAPTTAKISIILHGELGMSETRELISEDDRPMFDRSSRDHFLLTLPDSLGRISKVQLWHNNAGPSPRWFLTQVLVRDLITGKVQYFLCEKWFAVDEGDGRVERELVALDNSVSFMQIFAIKGRQYMADLHTWGSVFTRPAHSHFTRVQRLTCCLSLLLSYMALNAAWYQRQPEQARGEFGLLDVSWRSLAVGGICCGLVSPLHLLLVFLFRRSRVSHSSCEHNKLETSHRTSSHPHTTPTTTTTTAHTAPITTSTTSFSAAHANTGSVSQYAETGSETVASSQWMTTYSLLDQSILNWQSIQDWAQRQWVKRQTSPRSSAVSVKTNPQPPAQPCPTQPVQHTLLADEETDGVSSGFEDAVSQATAERHRVKPASESSSDGRRSHISEDDGARPHICLPAWCRYVAWVLCVIVCTLSATVTILYGFRFGSVKSVFWLQSLYFSFMVCIFLAQPFWILVSVAWLAIRNRDNPAVFDHCSRRSQVREGLSAWHSRQRHILETSDHNAELERGVRARQRSRYLRFSRPPQERFLQASRKKLMKEKNAANFLRDLVVFVFLFTLVCVMAYGKDLSSHFRLKQSLDSTLLRGSGESFHSIHSIPDWHRWAQSTLLDALFGTHTSPGLLMKQGEGEGNNVLIGYPLLRQLRVREEHCPDLPYLVSPSQHCLYGYDGGSGDGEGDNDSWVSPRGAGTVWGEMAIYSPGGVGLALNQSSREDATRQLKSLEEDHWLDRRSRAVIIEMTLLNVPTTLFSSVVLLVELPASGGALPSPQITSTCLFRYVTTWDNCVLACELLFILLAMVKIQSELSTMVGEGRSYFLWPWNYTQLLLCLTSLAYIACYIYRFVLVSEMVEFLRNTFYEQFISFAFITAWDELLRWQVGLLLFLVVVTQGLRLVRYCPHLAKSAAVYRRARRQVALMALLFIVYTGAFSNAGALLFGSVSRSMRTTMSASLTVVAMATGMQSVPDLEGDGSPWFVIFSIFAFTLGCGFITAYAVAFLTQRVGASRGGELLVMGKCELFDFCLGQLLLCVGARKLTPVHEPQVQLPPECTLAEFEYQVEELLFRMNALAGTTNLPEKPTGYLTDSDQSHAIGDDGISSGGSEPVVHQSGEGAGVDGGRLEQRVQKIEDKLCANEPYLAQLLQLDSIGTDILSPDREKKLRSHLEMEIFRQLQMKRQETGKVASAGDHPLGETVTNPVPVATTLDGKVTAGKPSASLSSRATEDTSGIDLHSGIGRADSEDERTQHIAGCNPATSSDDSPRSDRALLCGRGEDTDVNPPRLGGSKLQRSRKSVRPQTVKGSGAPDKGIPVSPDPDPLLARRHPSEPEAEAGHTSRKHGCEAVCPSLPKGQGEGTLAGGAHKATLESGLVERSHSMRGHRHRPFANLASVERSDSLRTSNRRPLPDLSLIERSDSLRSGSRRPLPDLSSMERSDSLRSGGRRPLPDLSSMERSDSLRLGGRRTELPPKPTFAAVPVVDSRRSPKPPALKIPATTFSTIQTAGSGSLWRPEGSGGALLGESSSGSDPDGLLSAGSVPATGGRRSQGQGRRNLRKTKSRGKGKGAGSLTPTLLLDDLSFSVHEPPKDAEDVGVGVVEEGGYADE